MNVYKFVSILISVIKIRINLFKKKYKKFKKYLKNISN